MRRKKAYVMGPAEAARHPLEPGQYRDGYVTPGGREFMLSRCGKCWFTAERQLPKSEREIINGKLILHCYTCNKDGAYRAAPEIRWQTPAPDRKVAQVPGRDTGSDRTLFDLPDDGGEGGV